MDVHHTDPNHSQSATYGHKRTVRTTHKRHISYVHTRKTRANRKQVDRFSASKTTGTSPRVRTRKSRTAIKNGTRNSLDGGHLTSEKYLVEIRVGGRLNEKLRDLVKAIKINFDIKSKFRYVPHITIMGELSTSNQKDLIDTVQNVVKDYDLVSFRLGDFGEFPGRAVHARVLPSAELKEMQQKLVESLRRFCELKAYDLKGSFKPHATICLDTDLSEKTEDGIKREFGRILEFLESWKLPDHKQHALRVSVIGKNRTIVCEYDLILRRMLSRREALDMTLFKETMLAFEKMVKRSATNAGKRLRFTDESRRHGTVFVLSDLHFDHTSIIRRCRRPFSSTPQMNRILVDNWNSRVGEGDRVYYLGDITHGRKRRSIDFWLSKLNGEVRFIRGNRDTDAITKAEVIKDRFPIRYRGFEFLLMHDPYRPPYWDGWIIHGAKHNTHPVTYPHINRRNKTINVCSEYIGYVPISLDEIIAKI